MRLTIATIITLAVHQMNFKSICKDIVEIVYASSWTISSCEEDSFIGCCCICCEVERDTQLLLDPALIEEAGGIPVWVKLWCFVSEIPCASLVKVSGCMLEGEWRLRLNLQSLKLLQLSLRS